MTTREQAFPISAQISGQHGNFNVLIRKLSIIGFIAETDKPLGVGHHYTVNFVLPGYNETISAAGVVVKTYTPVNDPGKAKASALSEIQFKLDAGQKVLVSNFLKVMAGGKS